MVASDYINIWQAVLEDLKDSITPSIYDRRLKGTRCIGLRDRALLVAVPSENDLHYLKNGFARHVQHALTAVGAQQLRVEYIVDGDPEPQPDDAPPVEPMHGSPRGGSYSNGRGSGMTPLFGSAAPSLRDRYTFDSFIVGKNNMLAHAAALSVAQEPGRSYNPL